MTGTGCPRARPASPAPRPCCAGCTPSSPPARHGTPTSPPGPPAPAGPPPRRPDPGPDITTTPSAPQQVHLDIRTGSWPRLDRRQLHRPPSRPGEPVAPVETPSSPLDQGPPRRTPHQARLRAVGTRPPADETRLTIYVERRTAAEPRQHKGQGVTSVDTPTGPAGRVLTHAHPPTSMVQSRRHSPRRKRLDQPGHRSTKSARRLELTKGTYAGRCCG